MPWYAVGDFADKSSERENSHRLDERVWLGGRTSLPYPYSDEPDNRFMQMAQNPPLGHSGLRRAITDFAELCVVTTG